MRIMIMLACACIIGATAFGSARVYGEYKHSQRLAIKAKCASTWDGKPYDSAGKTIDDVRRDMAITEECIGYLKTGY